MPTLANFALFQVVWFAAVMGAAAGALWLGPVTTLLAVAGNLAASRRPVCDARLYLVVGLVGTVVESVWVATGVLEIPARAAWLPSWIAPLWIAGLWVAFATLLRGALAWLAPYPLLAAALGAVGGPLSFLGGARLGAVARPDATGLVALAVEWAILTPALLALAHRRPSVPPVPSAPVAAPGPTRS